MKYKTKQKEVEAIQFIGSNNPFGVIKEHKCGYRMCPVCGGDNQLTRYIKNEQDTYYKYVNMHNWIVKEGDYYKIFTVEQFENLYEKIEEKTKFEETILNIKNKVFSENEMGLILYELYKNDNKLGILINKNF